MLNNISNIEYPNGAQKSANVKQMRTIKIRSKNARGETTQHKMFCE